MIYRQDRSWIKITEVLVVYTALWLIDTQITSDLRYWQPSPFIFIILLFSLRYGWKLGMLTFGCTVAYYLAQGIMRGEDILILSLKMMEYPWMLVYFALAVVSGVYSSAHRERYEDVQFRNEELQSELTSIKSAVNHLEKTNKVLEERILQSESSIKSVYQMMTALDQEHVEVVTNEAVQILSSYFHADVFGIYHVDSSRRALRIKLRMGEVEKLPQTIFIDEAPTFYQRLFQEQQITIKRSTDEAAAPLIAGPILIKGEVRQVLIIPQIDLIYLTEHSIQLLYWLLRIISDSLEKAAKKTEELIQAKVYPYTTIYKKEFFDEYVAIEEERLSAYAQPYSLFALELEEVDEEQLINMSHILQQYLREVDKVGYDRKQRKLWFLLPGTEEKYIQSLKTRIYDKLQEVVTLRC